MNNALDILKKLWKNTSFNNFLNLSLNQGINVLVALISTPFLYQRLGEDQFGLVNLSLTITLMFGIIVSYGFHMNAPKRLALLLDNPREQASLINEVLVTRILLSIAVVSLVLLSIYLGAFESYAGIISFSLIVLLGEALYPLFILQGFDRLSLLAISNAITKVTFLVGLIVVIEAPTDAQWVNFMLGGSAFIVNLFLVIYIYAKRSYQFRWVSFSKVWKRLLDNYKFFSYSIGAYIQLTGGFILLGNFVSNEELGRYSVAQRVAVLLRTIPALMAQSILQNASRLYRDDRPAFEKYLKRVFHNGLLITLGIGIVFCFSAPWVVRVLAGEYVDYSTRILQMLCFLPFLGMLNIDTVMRILVAEHKEVLARAMWIGALVMLGTGVLGSHYYGGVGLAVATLFSEAFNFVIHWYLLRRKLARQSQQR